MVSVGAGRGYGGLCPLPLPRQGGGLGLGDFLPVGGRLGRRGGGRPWLHSGDSSPVYLVPLWALFSPVRSRMGWALVSSRVWPSGLSGALLPWSSSFLAVPDHPDLWPPCDPPRHGGGTGLCPHTRSSRPCGCCRRAAEPSRPFLILGTPRAGAGPHSTLLGSRLPEQPRHTGTRGGLGHAGQGHEELPPSPPLRRQPGRTAMAIQSPGDRAQARRPHAQPRESEHANAGRTCTKGSRPASSAPLLQTPRPPSPATSSPTQASETKKGRTCPQPSRKSSDLPTPRTPPDPPGIHVMLPPIITTAPPGPGILIVLPPATSTAPGEGTREGGTPRSRRQGTRGNGATRQTAG